MCSFHGKLRIHRMWQEPTGQKPALLVSYIPRFLLLVFEESFHFYQFSSVFTIFIFYILNSTLAVSVEKVK